MGNWAQDIAINTLWYNNTAGEDPTEAAGGTTPDSASVSNGSVAINTFDGKMWVKVTNGGLSGWEEVGGGGSGGITSLNNATVDELVTVGATTTELDAETNLTFDGSKLQIDGRTHHNTFLTTGSIPTGEYGVFCYRTGNLNYLAFSSAQTSAVQVAGNTGAAFWTMVNVAATGGNKLHLEPSVAFSSAKNNAWIGYNKPLVGVNAYYLFAGDGSAASPSISFYEGGDWDTGFYTSAANTIDITLGGTHEYSFTTSSFAPAAPDANDLGSSSFLWDDVWATNGTIETSDRRLKDQIKPTTLGLDFINGLNPVSYKWNSKSTSKSRHITHYGLVAQEVIDTLKDFGLNYEEDFAGITGDEETTYGARYTEFVPILIKAVKELSEKVKKLEEDK